MKEDIGKGLDGSSHYLNAVLSYYSPEGIEGNAQKASVKAVGVPAYGLTVRSACLFKTLYWGILNGVTL